MRIDPRIFALLVGLWGLIAALLARERATVCPLGSCPACGACFQPPPAAEAREDRVA